MKYELPENHELTESIVKNLVFFDGEKPALSDVQYASLQAGVGRGESMLVVSPTSTGKTQIGLWAIARSLEQGSNTVYLVTHRALAKQKFEDFKLLLLTQYLDSNNGSLVIATGDYVEDAEGQVPAEPLRAPLLIATYEKYLALLSASGVPKDMTGSVIVCDEIQLLGDEHRGQSVEVLLTLLRSAGWKQFVGLSAVLEKKDASELANWLDVELVLEHRREKHLKYECWTTGKKISVSTEKPDILKEEVVSHAGGGLDAVSAVQAMLRENPPPLPIIVFCMKKQDTYDLARDFVDRLSAGKKGQLSMVFDDLPETTANAFLSETFTHRVASHNADLLDEERHVVEQYLLEGKLDVVFATTTLAAGVNFPLGAAVFAGWTRWNSDRRTYVPIDASEFHNMAGRVGRMGFIHDHGRVVFFSTAGQLTEARKYLALGVLPPIKPRVTPERFNQLSLQLVSSGLCCSRSDLESLVCTTYSALREADVNIASFKTWPGKLNAAINDLISNGLLLETSSGKLSATPVGKAVGYSGLLPETSIFLLDYVVKHANYLSGLLPAHGKVSEEQQLAFLLFSACFSSPEFRGQNGVKPTRFLPYPLGEDVLWNPEAYSAHLAEPVWHADILPINAAWISGRWIDGAELKILEGKLPALRAGMLREMFRNLVWVLQGLSGIISAAADKRVPASARPRTLHIDDVTLDVIRKLPRAIRRFSLRVQEGLPEDAIWFTSLCPPGEPYRLARHEILALREKGLATPESLMLGTKEADIARAEVFIKAKPTPSVKANWIRDLCRNWKIGQRKWQASRHLKRARRCARPDLVEQFYLAKGEMFEKVFESILDFLKISFEKLDDRTKTGAPDYLLRLKDSPVLVMELKSKEGDKLVDYNKAVEVLAASEVHGYRDAFCITLCHPGVDPSVATVVASCGRLSVVESVDLGEALLRVCEGTMSEQQLWQWLATPGQALAADLPYREYGGA